MFHPRRIVLSLLVCLLVGAPIGLDARDFAVARPAIQLEDRSVPYFPFSTFVMPGQTVSISGPRVSGENPPPVPAGRVDRLDAESLAWRLPDRSGHYPLELARDPRRGTLRLHAFTLVPAGRIRGGTLNGYRIGSYPKRPYRGLSVYEPPEGFIEVTRSNRDTRISPHFRLGEFLCHQPSSYPKYMVLREELLLKLELILRRLDERGHGVEDFVIMSGFRTPAYNRGLGNVPHSRHLWGGAADIYVDESPRDGRMDDLNGDGRSDRRDAVWLANFVASLRDDPVGRRYVGGIGAYGSTSNHGPFVHVDARGFPARWGAR